MIEIEDSNAALWRSVADQTGFSVAAVAAMARAIAAGGGRMAQFDHPEFGGCGQWMAGGMLMIADWSDVALRARVAQLCDALATLPTQAATSPADALSQQPQSRLSGGLVSDDPTPADRTDGTWWPASFGAPDTSGAQDGMRYAWFGGPARLVIDDAGRLTCYDTGDHRIDGVSQQQGGARSLTFTSQHGALDIDGLAVVPAIESSNAPREAASANAGPATDPFVALERLADLHARGVVDDAEFTVKKAELLARI